MHPQTPVSSASGAHSDDGWRLTQTPDYFEAANNSELRPCGFSHDEDGVTATELTTITSAESMVELSLQSLWALARRYRRRLILLPLLLSSVAIAVAFLREPTFTSSFAFIVQSGRGDASRISGLAAQFGVAVAGQQQGQSPDFFLDVLRSRTLLESVIDSRYVSVVNGTPQQIAVPTLLNVDGSNDAERRANAVLKLKERIGGSVGIKTGVVDVSVLARTPEIAQFLGERLLDRLVETNVAMRKTRAMLERQFIERRLKDARDSLNAAEGRLSAFRANNRGDARSSPALQAQLERLDREVSLHTQLFLSLSQSEAQARLEALRSTPDITIVEPPSRPVFRDPRRAGVLGAIGMLVGFLLALLWVLLSEQQSARRVSTP